MFFLGTHKPNWLADARFASTPLFVSRRALARGRNLPRALTPWGLDSGGFTELSMFGRWTMTAPAYVAEVRRFKDEIGSLAWAAPQDWMCEPPMLKKTGFSIERHQELTIDNYLELRSLAPELPIIPVLQGWAVTDYWRHEDAYRSRGVDLSQASLVGVGTVCRRQNTTEAETIMRTLAGSGLRLHGFGFKVLGIARCRDVLASADSTAWSLHARKRAPLPGHDLPGDGRTFGHKNCANCAEYALKWVREKICTLPS